ncbi:MAG: Lrp/AsnC ligand binding domain-containing protein [Dehalococcoidia bacterium]
MTTKAFVLIETAVGKTREVSNALQNVEGMKSVDAVTGPYDIIAIMEADDLNTIGNAVTSKVHTVNGVVRTVTCLALGFPQ